MWMQSYKDHVIHISMYIAIVAICWKQLTNYQDSGRNTDDDDGSSGGALHFLLALGAVIGLYSELSYIRLRWNLPPGNPGYPLIGHFLNSMADPAAYNIRQRKKFGSAVTVNVFMNPFILFSDDDDAAWILKQERKGKLGSFALSFFQKLIGPGVIMFQQTIKHKRLRKIFEPAFSPASLQNYVNLIDIEAKSYLTKWSSINTTVGDDGDGDENNDNFCSSDEWAFLAMKLFFVCAFGEVKDELMEILHDLFERWVAGFNTFIPLNIPGSTLRKGHIAREELSKVLQRMVDEFKSQNPPGTPRAESTMMGRLCYAEDDDGKRLSDDELITNINFILFAGHDTTKGSFCAFIHYLLEDPKVHQLLFDEVKAFSEPLDMDELKAAPILNAFLAESWRLMAPLSSHVLIAKERLHYKDYVIPKGAMVGMDIQAYNEMNFLEGEKFILERWLPTDHPLHNPKYFAKGIDYNLMSVKYRTFNAGAHMCLGSHFAKLEARIVLTRLVQNYNVQMKNETVRRIPTLQYLSDFKLIPITS